MHWETFVLARAEYEERVNDALERGRIRRLRARTSPAISQWDRLLAGVGQGLVAWGLWLQERARPQLAPLPPTVSRQNG
ncbi:MAG: hypothetical protein HY328_03700 [Chloroflexi bacterium]|nr:hypothetical protein [Chloroflexota bacterium]